MIAQHFIFENHDPSVLMDAFNEAAALWKKNGAKEVSLWRLQGTKINRFSFSVRCENMEQMGKCMDNLAADADFAAWQMKYFGSSTIRENVIGRLVAEGKSNSYFKVPIIKKKPLQRPTEGAVQERYCTIIAMRTKVEHDSSEVNLPKPFSL